MRRSLTNRLVAVMSALILLLCVGWAVLVQRAVPDACSYTTPPAKAQYLHCDKDSDSAP
ncbi:MAG TPA: hypothetical protein VJ976_04005 [Ornithinimicrobium sp.]|uniref:hypothetical protein n=1 Tax=Ornithinimicrobium sp. TaxID=1977084 RepID=UPI002B45C9E6|nr:hypothetical protein [Ornithinimicrobium sp.]HKJ11537.1 hypothetical protein [Ornithinimicrobium sp.]